MRLSTGVDGIDELLNGGLPANRLHVVSGPPGSGKTTFASQFIARGAQEGERSLYISMHESERELVKDMSSFEFGFDKAVASDLVSFVDATDNVGHFQVSKLLDGNNKSRPENLGTQIRGFVKSRDIGRVVIDSTMLLEFLFGDTDMSVTRLLTNLKKTDATLLLVSEMKDPASYSDEHYLAHGVLFFHNYLDSDGMVRGFQILKMRGTDIDTDIYEISFSSAGLEVDTGAKVSY